MPPSPADTRASGSTCLICGADATYDFSRVYPTFPGSPFADDLRVDYWRCGGCGFVYNRTYRDMPADVWAALNTSWHHNFESDVAARVINQPPYADQAVALTLLARNGIVDLHNALDYAAGYGTLARVLAKYFDTRLPIFDRYVHATGDDLAYIHESGLGCYQLVINSAMFEHVTRRADLDEVNDLVADNGVLMLHTLVCERVPSDPAWFYLEPMVHSAFHTNRSMSLLMQQWGYGASVYSPQAKSWFLFKDGHPVLGSLEATISAINAELQTRYFHYRAGFMDYWKGF